MRRIAPILASLVLAACATGTDPATTLPATTVGTEPTTTTTADAFPVSVEADNGKVIIEERPDAIVSLSATATEMLFAVGAGPQVVAVDDQSNYPEEAPTTDLSGFTPNLEAILSYQPDLVIMSFEPADAPLSAGLAETGVPALVLDAAQTIEDVYRQIEVIGEATGNLEAARTLDQELRQEIEAIVAETGTAGEGVTYYHELDPALFTVTSETFIGQIYELLGMENIADAADPEGTGFPQLSAEYIVAQDPDMIFLADAEFGESAETLAGRPGWQGMAALESGAVVELDADIASRWGPRIVDFLRTIADVVQRHAVSG
ncbi:MAG: ABC transporter substrate-binding protein [Acidimicrobiia bacterium]